MNVDRLATLSRASMTGAAVTLKTSAPKRVKRRTNVNGDISVESADGVCSGARGRLVSSQ